MVDGNRTGREEGPFSRCDVGANLRPGRISRIGALGRKNEG